MRGEEEMVMKRGRQKCAGKTGRNCTCPGAGVEDATAAGQAPGPKNTASKFQGLRSELLRPGGAELRPPGGMERVAISFNTAWGSSGKRKGER